MRSIMKRRSARASSRILYEEQTRFGRLRVVEEGNHRSLINDSLTQNVYDTGLRRGVSMFPHVLEGLARMHCANLEKALCIGLGIGMTPRRLAAEGVVVEVVDINSAIPGIARNWFDFDPGIVHLHIADGREYVAHQPGRFDAVILDAFNGGNAPLHLLTREAVGEWKRVLRKNGVLLVNCFSGRDAEGDPVVASVGRTLGTGFPHVQARAMGNGNVFFAASSARLQGHRDPLDYSQTHPLTRRHVIAAFAGTIQPDTQKGLILEDAHWPWIAKGGMKGAVWPLTVAH